MNHIHFRNDLNVVESLAKPCVKILSAHMTAHVTLDTLVMVLHALIKMNVILVTIHVTIMLNVSIE